MRVEVYGDDGELLLRLDDPPNDVEQTSPSLADNPRVRDILLEALLFVMLQYRGRLRMAWR